MSLFSRLLGSKKEDPVVAPAQKLASDVIYDFRHVKDVNNIVPYETLLIP